MKSLSKNWKVVFGFVMAVVILPLIIHLEGN